MQLSPKSAIPVSYTASIPDDTTTYYVQAVLRDTATSTTIQTLNLTQESSVPNRYVGSFNPVSDPSGLGRPVDVTISVYTDAGHTMLSPNYQILQIAYVVLQPFIANLGNGGGGSNISYEKIGLLVEAIMDKKGKDAPNVHEIVMGAIGQMEKPQGIDYDRMESLIEELAQAHRSEIPGIVGGVHSRVDMSDATHKKEMDAMRAMVARVEARMEELHRGHETLLRGTHQDLRRSIDSLPAAFDGKVGKVDEYMQSAAERMQQYLEQNFGDKEIKMTYGSLTGMGGKKNVEKEKPMFDPMSVMQDLL